jgi:hypothetical protein
MGMSLHPLTKKRIKICLKIAFKLHTLSLFSTSIYFPYIHNIKNFQSRLEQRPACGFIKYFLSYPLERGKILTMGNIKVGVGH